MGATASVASTSIWKVQVRSNAERSHQQKLNSTWQSLGKTPPRSSSNSPSLLEDRPFSGCRCARIGCSAGKPSCGLCRCCTGALPAGRRLSFCRAFPRRATPQVMDQIGAIWFAQLPHPRNPGRGCPQTLKLLDLPRWCCCWFKSGGYRLLLALNQVHTGPWWNRYWVCETNSGGSSELRLTPQPRIILVPWLGKELVPTCPSQHPPSLTSLSVEPPPKRERESRAAPSSRSLLVESQLERTRDSHLVTMPKGKQHHAWVVAGCGLSEMGP